MTTLAPQELPVASQALVNDVEYQYAGFWIRVMANVIDTILLFLVLIPLVMALLFLGVIDLDAYATNQSYTWFDFVSQLVFFVLYVGLWVKFAGTPGKRLLRLKILDEKTGNHLTLGRAIIRYLGYIPAFLVFCIGVIWVAFDKKKQGWHDKMAKTVVVKELN